MMFFDSLHVFLPKFRTFFPPNLGTFLAQIFGFWFSYVTLGFVSLA